MRIALGLLHLNLFRDAAPGRQWSFLALGSLFLLLFAAKDQSSVHSRTYSPAIGRPSKRMWHMIMAILHVLESSTSAKRSHGSSAPPARALWLLDRLDAVEAGIDRHCRCYCCGRRCCNVLVPEFLGRCRRAGGDRKRRCRLPAAVGAISLGSVGPELFTRRIGRNG